MSTRLKLSPTVVINADEITQVTNRTANSVEVYTTITTSYGGEYQATLTIAPGTGKAANLVAAINAALVAAPGGRVIEVPAGDYTVGAISYASSI